MTVVTMFALVAMPLSLILSLYYVHAASPDPPSLFSNVWKVSAFYSAWCILAFVLADDSRRTTETLDAMTAAHVTFPILFATSVLERKWPSVAATFVVLGNVGFVCGLAFSTGAEDLAMEMLGDDADDALGVVYVWMFRSYLMGHNILWGPVFVRFIKMPSVSERGGYSEVPGED